MTIPRLASDGVGRGRFMPCVALCGPLWAVLVSGNIGTLQDGKAALRACKWPLRRFCVFASPLPRCAKMPPRGHRMPRKRREAIGGYRKHGKKKTRPRKAQGGRCGTQDFFAVSQITISGRSKTNRTIKRGSPPFSGGRVKLAASLCGMDLRVVCNPASTVFLCPVDGSP